MSEEAIYLLMPKWGYKLAAVVLSVIGFIGFSLNLLVIVLMGKERRLWTPLNIIIFNLVCCDFLVALLGNPLTLIAAISYGWPFGDTMCVIYGFFMALLGINSITTLTVISFERYLLVTKSLVSNHLTTKGAVRLVLCIWIYSFLLTVPPLLGWGKYVSEAANISCSINWFEHSYNSVSYIMFLFVMGQIVPLVVILYSYLKIVKTLKENSRRFGRVSRVEKHVTKMVFIMIAAFLLAWAPYSAFALKEQFFGNGEIPPGAGVIPALIAKSSICYNPLIYVGMNAQFQESIRKIFGFYTSVERSENERVNCNTTVSPVPRLAIVNEAPSRNSPEVVISTAPQCNDRPSDDVQMIVVEARVEAEENLNRTCSRASDLSTIQEIESDLDPDYITYAEESNQDEINNSQDEFPFFPPFNSVQELGNDKIKYGFDGIEKMKNWYGHQLFRKRSYSI